MLGSPDFPGSGAINELRRDIENYDARRRESVEILHKAVADMPDTIIRKLNGTYVKADDFPFVLAAALRARRSKRWQRVTGQGGKVAAGVLIIVLAAVFLALIHLANPSLP